MDKQSIGSLISAMVYSVSTLLVPQSIQADVQSNQQAPSAQVQNTQTQSVNDTLPQYPPRHHVRQWIQFMATWYDGEKGINGTGTGITKSGAHVQNDWTIAVDPNVIPLGSIVEVQFQDGSVQRYHAEDTGGAIKGNRIDIYNPSVTECFKNGKQTVSLCIVETPQTQPSFLY